MLIKASESEEKKNTDSCTVREYHFPSKELGFATARIDGRYPDSGKAVNKACDQIYFVLSGAGKIHYEGEIFSVEAGDALFFEKGKKYYVEGDTLEIAVITAPTWFAGQYTAVNE
ncbi:MAG: cupin domain-containing protein [Candidatus Aenigmatarchaeota archaeon]